MSIFEVFLYRNQLLKLISYFVGKIKQNSMFMMNIKMRIADCNGWSAVSVLVWIISLIGFTYQSYGIITLYLNYPTSINLQVNNVDSNFQIPAISVCLPMIMLIRPSKLESLLPEMRHKYELLHAKVPDYEPESYKLTLFWKNLNIYLHNMNISRSHIRSTFMDQVIINCKRIDETGFGNHTDCSASTNISITYDDSNQCYTMFDKYSNNRVLTKTVRQIRPYLAFYVRLDNTDGLLLPRRAYLIIHDPNTKPLELIGNNIELVVNSYLIDYSKFTFKLLEKPFSTQCITYSDNGHYSSQNDCYDKCLTRSHLNICRCIPSGVTIYDRIMEEKICCIFNSSCINHTNLFIQKDCHQQCLSVDCHIVKYKSQICNAHKRVRVSEGVYLMDIKNNTAKVIINTPITDDEVFSYEPKYDIIEIVCYIASLLGLWFGLSVLSLTKVIRNSFVTRSQIIKKFSCCKNHKLTFYTVRKSVVTPISHN